MMWHWLVAGLASGVTVVLYDGSPFRPLFDGNGDLAMAGLIEEFGYATKHPPRQTISFTLDEG